MNIDFPHSSLSLSPFVPDNSLLSVGGNSPMNPLPDPIRPHTFRTDDIQTLLLVHCFLDAHCGLDHFPCIIEAIETITELDCL